MAADRPQRHRRVALLLLCFILPTPALHAAQATEYQFAVHFDDKRIGSHTFEVIQSSSATRVHSRAEFEVKVLFIRVYRYRHQANELWRDGCITALASATDENGDRFRVRAAAAPEGLLLTREHEQPEQDTRITDTCPGTFAYWDRSRLQRERLLNAQTGEAVTAELTFEGEEAINGIQARRYRLSAGDLPSIDLWYDSKDRWLALRTERDGGALEYRLEHVAQRTVSGIDEDAGVEDPVGI